MNYEEFKKTVFGVDYCDKESYITEAFFANPHKYPDSERDKLIHHMKTCTRCTHVYYEDEEQKRMWDKIMKD
jgi:hypothetical protein